MKRQLQLLRIQLIGPGPTATLAKATQNHTGGPLVQKIERFFQVGFLLTALAVAAKAELSEKTRMEIAAAFPQFAALPPKPTVPVEANRPAPLSDDPLEVLPDYHVRDKPTGDKNPDRWLSRRALAAKALIEYGEMMTDLEWALNSWHIPLAFGYSLTPSVQSRANAAYAEKKILKEQRHLTDFAESLAAIDSVEAKKLLHDLDLSGHPGN